MRQRLTAAGATGLRGAVSSRQGMPASAAARDRRREAVSPTACRQPTTRAGARERKPSSMAQSVSASRAVRATSRRSGESPRAARPGACRRPCSPVWAPEAHHSTTGAGPLTASRRTARRSARASADGQSSAVAGFNSWVAASARAPGGRTASRPGSPKHQAPGAAADRGRGTGRVPAVGAEGGGSEGAPPPGDRSALSAPAAVAGSSRRAAPRLGATSRGAVESGLRSSAWMRARRRSSTAWRPGGAGQGSTGEEQSTSEEQSAGEGDGGATGG